MTADAWAYERDEARDAQADAYDDRPTAYEIELEEYHATGRWPE